MELDFSKKISKSKDLSDMLAEQKSRKQINDLPDSDFAYIESGGSKDESGRTVPRSRRHLPIMDCAHVKNALARLSQTKISGEAKASAFKKIKAAAKKCRIEVSESDVKDWEKTDEKNESKAGLPPWLEKKKKGDGDKKDDEKSDDKKDDEKSDDKKSDDKKSNKKDSKKKEESKGQGIAPLNNIDFEEQLRVKDPQRLVKTVGDDEEEDEKELKQDDKKEKKEHEKDAINDDKKQVKDLKKDEKEDKKNLEKMG